MPRGQSRLSSRIKLGVNHKSTAMKRIEKCNVSIVCFSASITYLKHINLTRPVLGIKRNYNIAVPVAAASSDIPGSPQYT
jgi:hypothetical protein